MLVSNYRNQDSQMSEEPAQTPDKDLEQNSGVEFPGESLEPFISTP